MGNVKYTIVGNADDAAKAVDKLRSQFDKLEQKLRDQAKYSRQSKAAGNDYANSQIASLKNMVLGIASVQTAWNLATAALKAYADNNQRLQDNRQAVASSARETEIKLINQGSLSPEETARTMQNIDAASQAIPVGTVHDSKRMTEEMFSQGFDRQEVINGEALKKFLALKAATNQFGEGAMDSKELVKSIAMSLRNTEGRDPGAAITAQEIEKFGRAFHSLFLTQSIQLQDAIPFARIQSVLTARGIDEKTQLAAFSVAVDALGAERGATGLQQATAFLGAAGSAATKAKLEKLGINIDTESFDLIGEDLVEALRNLNQELGTLDPRQAADAREALFGKEAQAAVMTLATKTGDIEESRRKIGAADGAAYDPAVTQYRISDQARAVEIAQRKEIGSTTGLKSQQNMTFEDVQAIIDATYERLKQEGAGTAQFSANVAAADIRRNIGFRRMEPQEYLNYLQLSSGGGRQQEILQREIDKADPRTKQMEVIRDALREENPTGEEPPRPEIVFPQQMEVNDPQLQTSVDQLNTTMTRVADYLERGPDQQRVVRVPRATA